jgi:integrase
MVNFVCGPVSSWLRRNTKRGIHALKHTLGQDLADRGTDIGTMRVIMGHRLITSSQHYFEVTQAAADSATFPSNVRPRHQSSAFSATFVICVS